jgi:hypothetical protein
MVQRKVRDSAVVCSTHAASALPSPAQTEAAIDNPSQLSMRKVRPLNPYGGGVSRTIKAQYQQTSTANLIREGTFAATGAMEYYEQ